MSPDNSIIPPLAQIVDSFGQVWTLSGTDVFKNGQSAAGGTGTQILWVNRNLFVFGTDLNWWLWTGTTWTMVGPLQPSPSERNLLVVIVPYDELQTKVAEYQGNIKFAGIVSSGIPNCPPNSFVLLVDVP